MKQTFKWIALVLAIVMAAAMFTGCAKKSTSVIVIDDTFGDEEYGIGFRNGDVAFGLKVQEAFDAVVASGKGAEIAKQWLGEDLILKGRDYMEESVAADDDDSWTKIQEKGVMVLGLDASFPPMGYLDENNEIVGFDIDLAKAVAAELGVELICQPIDWDAKELELNNGNIDFIWNGMTITDERIASMFFTKPYLANEQIVLVGNNSGIKTKADLKGKNVAVQAGSSGQEAVEADAASATFKELVTYEDYVSAYQDLKIGRVDALVIDSIVGYYLIATDTAN